MPRASAGEKKPRISRFKKAAKTGTPVAFYVAPTTPFIPARPNSRYFSIKTAPSIPSPHLVDLRTVTAKRPLGTERKTEKTPLQGFSSANIPRTLSERPGSNRIWDQFALVAFGRFVFGLIKIVVMGIGSIVTLPLTIGLKIVDRFDPDKPQPLSETVSTQTNTEDKYAEPKPVSITRTRRPFNMRRALVSFAGTSLAIILPLQGFNAFQAFENIKNQAQNAQIVSLGALSGASSLADAQAAIEKTQQTVNDLGRLANTLLEHAPRVGGMFRSGKELLNAGSDLATAATLLSRSLDFINDPALLVTDKLARAEELAKQAEPLLKSAQKSLDEANALPEGIDENLSSLKDKVADMENITSAFLNIAPSLGKILGADQARRYLVIFQNNAELRPTGGFIGSFAIVDVDRGAVKSVQVPAGGSYDLQGSLKANVLAPEPLRLVRAKWEFQDANWFPDFETSAKKLSWFYNQSSGPTVDGVIALNAPILADLLDAVGPINMPAYGTVATSTTVLKTAQEIVESPGARASGKPKQFIADLLPLVLDKLMNASGNTAVKTLSIFAKALEEKNIQLQFNDQEAEKAFTDLGWTGKLAVIPDGFDSIELVRANIAGAKTDAVIKTTIKHESNIQPDGRVINHVTVNLAHEGKKGDQFTGVRNVSYLRLYVPQGSKLIKASGDINTPAYSFFDIPEEGTSPDQTVADVSGAIYHDLQSGTAINNELNRTVFGVWTQTDPGNKSSITFDYELPFLVTPTLSAPTIKDKLGLGPTPVRTAVFGLVIEKQSGAEQTEINSTLKIPGDWYPSFASPEGIASTNGWTYTTKLNSNKVIGTILAR